MSSAGPDVQAGARLLRSRLRADPEVVVVLGSGLGDLVDRLHDPAAVHFDELPGFPPAGVAGHPGRWVGGWLGERAVLVQAGRYHVYEGHPDTVVAAPVRLAAALGARFLIVTNASGAVNPLLEAGTVVLVDDHINLMGRNPLIGPTRGAEARFPDMSAPYDHELQTLVLDAARELGIPLRRGVYAGVSGPSYETAAEVVMLRRLGADLVGMSTVPEVVTARACGLRCLALSVAANKAVGLTRQRLSHEAVVAVVRAAGEDVGRLLGALVARLPQADPGLSPGKRSG